MKSKEMKSIKIYIVKHEYAGYSGTVDYNTTDITEVLNYFTNKEDAEEFVKFYKEDCLNNDISYPDEMFYIDEEYLNYRDSDFKQ